MINKIKGSKIVVFFPLFIISACATTGEKDISTISYLPLYSGSAPNTIVGNCVKGVDSSSGAAHVGSCRSPKVIRYIYPAVDSAPTANEHLWDLVKLSASLGAQINVGANYAWYTESVTTHRYEGIIADNITDEGLASVNQYCRDDRNHNELVIYEVSAGCAKMINIKDINAVPTDLLKKYTSLSASFENGLTIGIPRNFRSEKSDKNSQPYCDEKSGVIGVKVKSTKEICRSVVSTMEIGRLTNKLGEKNKTIIELEKRIRELEIEADKKDSDIAILNSKITSIEKDLSVLAEDYDADVASNIASIEQLRNENTMLEIKINEVEADKKKIETELEKHEKIAVQQEMRIIEEMRDKQTYLSELNNKTNELTETKVHFKDKIAEMSKKIKNLSTQVN